MLKTLFTPLRARFDLSPRSPPSVPEPEPDDELAPEDFARDVLIELMRNSVENLKQADSRKAQIEVLLEIERILLQESQTKDVFRELDGFLVLISVLSNVQLSHSSPVIEPEEQVLADVIECTRVVFVVASEATNDHFQNAEYFRTYVGYQSLESAMHGLVSNPKTLDETLGFLLSFALCEFSASGIFCSLLTFGPKLANTNATIHHPGAIYLLWNFLPKSYASYKLLELLAGINHRNRAILSVPEVVQPLLDHLSRVTEKREKTVVQRLSRKLLDMGASPTVARGMFQRAIKEDGALDMELLELIRAGMKSRWLEHFSFRSSAELVFTQEGIKSLPVTGFTFMIWLWIEKFPRTNTSQLIFAARVSGMQGDLLSLRLHHDGKLELLSSGSKQSVEFTQARILRAKWTQVLIAHYPGKDRFSNPSIRLFIDGVLTDTVHWNYPKASSSAQAVLQYVIGDSSKDATMDWCFSSCYMIALPLADDIPRFIHHLGPRYYGSFQDPSLSKFLTYEASTSLNMFLSNLQITASQRSPLPPTPLSASAKSPSVVMMTQVSSSIVKAVKDGIGLPESAIIFALSPLNCLASGFTNTVSALGGGGLAGGGNSVSGKSETSSRREFVAKGDIYVMKAQCLDSALWREGGAAVALRLIQVAQTPHEISRALGVVTDGMKNSWQNSEDIERLRGYDILADILRSKAEMLNMTSFETLFEFLGLNFRSPDHSTIVNVVAYRALALDFELWSHTRKDIQRVHFEHFLTLLDGSRYRRFNIKQRFAKIGLVRRLLFVLQTDWYQADSLPSLMDALKSAAQALWTKDDAIKPLVSYLAANLQEDVTAESPRSIISRFDYKDGREKAEQVLIILTSILCVPACYTKFIAALPLPRICLLLLGDKPTTLVATQILTIIGISIGTSISFLRKFELISGWNVLKTVLPSCWSSTVNELAFDVLLGRLLPNGERCAASEDYPVVCPPMVPVILSALRSGLSAVAKNCEFTEDPDAPSQYSWTTESTIEELVENLMNLHASSTTFREVFQSQQTTQLFIVAYKGFVEKLSNASQVNLRTVSILEKISHVGLALALDNAVAGSQKREILDILQSAESVLNPSAEKTNIDPSLVQDTRTVRQRFVSARFSVQVGERTVIKTVTRMIEWRKTIRASEKKRLRKNILDLRESRRQVSRLYEWTLMLTAERGLWANQEPRKWRLDETEGPHRIRKKLEPENNNSMNDRADEHHRIRDVVVPEEESGSAAVQVEVPPWAESYEISSTDTMEDRQLAEEIAEDKHRRVRHELEPGDVIECVGTVARIAGVDSSPGLLIIGQTHIYMLDGLVESEDGEVIDAHDAPKSLFFVPGSIVELDGPQRAQRWSHAQINTFSNKTFLFRDVALELYFKDSRSLLVVFIDKIKRSEIDQRLTAITRSGLESNHTRTPIFGIVSARVLSGLWADELSTAQRRWQAREISNFTYLCVLNQISGRTPSDATQYPVYPWILQDYTSADLDLSNPETFRDLTKPMGALTAARREAAETRYSNLASVDEAPFHYGTHFSSSMIVCHFLIRMAPFTQMFKVLQGGDWDLPDRLFSDVARAYESAAKDVRGDVRELIPEFFNCPEFLENSANHDFGVLQATGERIHDVKLPPWAKQDPLLFIIMNRKALESNYVSENLHTWIDLIWGHKQRDPACLNSFHPLSYEGSIDLDTITDELEREATVGIIHNFGQTPRKLFTSPHPLRYNHGLPTLPIGTLHGIEEDAHLLVQGSRCFRDLGANAPVMNLVIDMIGEKILPCPAGVLMVPSHPHEQIEWTASRIGSKEMRVVVDHKVVQVIEGSFCSCAAFADSNTLVTGSSDYTVRIWMLARGVQSGSSNGTLPLSVSPVHIMRVHTDEVVNVVACRAWSIIVSGSRDGSAALWDLNRAVYVQSIWHGDGGEMTAVSLIDINESTGYIATCSRVKLCLHTINARPIVILDLTTLPNYTTLQPTITSLAFHEREYSHLGVLATGSSDGTITLMTWNADNTPEGEKARWEFVTLRSMKVRPPVGRGTMPHPVVTALKFLGESLCHGEDTGKSYMWSLPD
ncbi:beach-domain-containing protein [Rhodocollybia butyracea]|uniref:Beach-domain-containing protein n=1 Tax=Rhodocollybia butyracea TaxID=206335 RepID=A0A9P5PRA4_9AGAR|nr:beach-domain-containing protein [Rhodocollybia butyracea]